MESEIISKSCRARIALIVLISSVASLFYLLEECEEAAAGLPIRMRKGLIRRNRRYLRYRSVHHSF